jgi:hypothetical protein
MSQLVSMKLPGYLTIIFIMYHTNSPRMIKPVGMTIPEAAEVFGISGRMSLNAIHARFHELVRKWHPDVAEYDPDIAHATFIRIKEAYDILVDYSMNYELSFQAEDIIKTADNASKEYWMSHFGDDPIWG